MPPEPVVPETQMLPVMKVPMQYGTTGPSTVPPEPVVPETQVLPVMTVPMQYGTAGPSTVPATQISALISKGTTQNSTALSTDRVAETPKTHSNVMLSISEVGSDDVDEVDSINTQADLFEDCNESEVTTSEQQNQPNNNVTDDEQPPNSQVTGDFQCSRCFQEFAHYLMYTKHIDTCQGPKRKYRCIQPGCTQEFSQRSIMLQHNQSVHLGQPFFCPDKSCNHRYKSQKALKAHIKEHHEKVFKFKCTVCRQKFIHKAQYNTHLTRHTNVKPFACNHCKNAAYTTAMQLTQHVAMCMFGSPFRCEMCGKSFSSQTTMKQHHQNVHVKLADFPCDLCPKIYKQYASLWKHRCDKHGNHYARLLTHANISLKQYCTELMSISFSLYIHQ